MLGVKALLEITRPPPNTVRQTIQGIFRKEHWPAIIKPETLAGVATAMEPSSHCQPRRKNREGMKRDRWK